MLEATERPPSKYAESILISPKSMHIFPTYFVYSFSLPSGILCSNSSLGVNSQKAPCAIYYVKVFLLTPWGYSETYPSVPFRGPVSTFLLTTGIVCFSVFSREPVSSQVSFYLLFISFPFIIYLFASISVFVGACMHTSKCTNMCVCVWRPELNLEVSYSGYIHLVL